MNRDFVEILQELSAAGAEFLVVGAHALAAHERPRATGDIDIWVRPTSENASRVWNALVRFGAPLYELSLEDLTTPDIGREDLIRNKRPSGRAKDLVDVANLEGR